MPKWGRNGSEMGSPATTIASPPRSTASPRRPTLLLLCVAVAWVRRSRPCERPRQGLRCPCRRGVVQVRRVGEVVDENQDLVQLLHLELLAGLGDLALLADDLPQRRLVPVLEVDLLPVRGHLHGLLDVLLHAAPAVVHVDVDALKAASVLLQDHGDQGHRLAQLARPEQNAGRGQFGHHWVAWLLASVVWGWEDLDLAHALTTAPCNRRRSSTSVFNPRARQNPRKMMPRRRSQAGAGAGGPNLPRRPRSWTGARAR